MKILSPIIFFLFVWTNLQSQYISGITKPDTSVPISQDTSDVSVKLANMLLADEIKSHLQVLASDEYEGRETGEAGNKKAARYISDYFNSLGLPKVGDDNSYFQKVAFTTVGWENTELYVRGKKHKHLWDYIAFPSENEHVPFIGATEITFLGYGIEDNNYNDYKGKDVRDKVIMIYRGEPVNRDSVSYVTQSRTLSDWTVDKKLELAKAKGAKLVIVIEPFMKEMLNNNRRKLIGSTILLGNQLTEPVTKANHIFVSPQTAQIIWGDAEKKILSARNKITKKGKPNSVTFDQQFAIRMEKKASVLEGENVMAYIEGTDKKDELIVISAHYDHIGKRNDDVYNGADDNGSGTSTVLEIARTLSDAKKMGISPRRSILCLLVTGEEKGLLGSQYYSERPVFDLENTVANINVDMIGRVDKAHKDNNNYIYVIGSDRLSTDLHKINEDMNQKYSHIELDYTFNDEKDPNRFYYRSDHYNFARNGIPAIFFFSGVHEDYHRVSDTVDKIIFEKVEKIGRLIFHTAWELANREDRIVVDGEVKRGGR